MRDFKELYCKTSDYTSDCLLYPVISLKGLDIIKLSYLRFYNKPNSEINKKVFVKESSYKSLQVSYDTFTEEDFNDILNIIKEAYKNLPNGQKELLLDKVNIFLNSKGVKVDLFLGILLKDSIAFFNNSDDETMDYIKFITRL